MGMRSRGLFVEGARRLGRPSSASPLFFIAPRARNTRVAVSPCYVHSHSFATPASVAPTPEPEEPNPSPPEEEKTKRRGTSRGSAKAVPSQPESSAPSPPAVYNPTDAVNDILWPPEQQVSIDYPQTSAGLPKSWLVQKAFYNLSLTLHPQTQHRATYPSVAGPPIEPTLALYCPIEGGDYVIDATVREIATQAGADVLVIDAVHLAAGEWGRFGKNASALQFPQNPLHVSNAARTSSSSRSAEDDEDDDDSPPHVLMNNSPMFSIQIPSTLQIASGFRPARIGSGAPSARAPSSSKTKAFFDELINLRTSSADESGNSQETSQRPRIIYVRDFATIASSASSWWPALLAAIRSRRQGPISRPTSPVLNPTTVIFGVTPPLYEHPAPVPSPSHGLLGMLMGNRPTPPPRPVRQDTWDEDDHRARERRLKERVRKWEKGDAWIRDELPRFTSSAGSTSGSGLSGVGVVMGGRVVQMPGGRMIDGGSKEDGEGSAGADADGYFRVVGLVPGERDLGQEKRARIFRRQEINELVLRMAFGSVGGSLARLPDEIDGDLTELLEEWGKRLQEWRVMKEIADVALAWTLRHGQYPSESKSTLNLTEVSWYAVAYAWREGQLQKAYRKSWAEEAASTGKREVIAQEDDSREAEEDDEDESEEAVDEEYDEVVENIKRDPDLDPHEQRLLGCIVDPTSMPTTFASVHLPPATIDSVRTLVSLPLLYPSAFTQGILKTHTMTGALLFGPPGTGKTLVVRALAKESGARMMIIKPSDVMDMYVGEGEKLVRSVFTLARRLSPCVVFLDEIDALFGARVSTRESGGAIAHRGVITEFMQEMDGLKTGKEGNVIVIGATNRPFDLDDAVLRRLPRRLLVDLPGEKEREEILKILLRDEELSPDVDLHALAKRTESFSGSDLKHLCVSAALDAVKETVDLPWSVPEKPKDGNQKTPGDAATSTTRTSDDVPPEEASSTQLRVLALRHFTKALKEITPSASESLGTLADLRKWNEEFGEGSKRKKKNWGDRFGFGGKPGEEGRVVRESIVAPVAP